MLQPQLSPGCSDCRLPNLRHCAVHSVNGIFPIQTQPPAFIASKLWIGGASDAMPDCSLN